MDLGRPVEYVPPAEDGKVVAEPVLAVQPSQVKVVENPVGNVDHAPVVPAQSGVPVPQTVEQSAQPQDVPPVHPVEPIQPVHAVQPIPPAEQAPTATIDPNIPSSESAPTALPTNPATHPQEQKEAIENEHPAVVAREVEKTKAAEREIKGEKPKGTVVAGLEDDRLWQMLRRFDVVSDCFIPATVLFYLQTPPDRSKSLMSFTQPHTFLPLNPTFAPRHYQTFLLTRKSSSPIWKEF